ncbi:Serine/threonine protein kinase [Exophiala dermatitidis]|uniref:Male germ cell-associated kinase n=2 Tax=Exophiala dermatitidis TaxID=5970 RepID=H6C8C0_EXODN|nr:male germ cell-associated kinase [Exophiala dermatitidis NIH/UT8656]KAJ4523461.1 Serine/threonine protein kinase [Exophiala dermatitidis]EHY60347.1 male germ cell-associated kinase [Exophiala dermatitidis NIH/UT8656]KAJ4524508.1 Serine/threonine protein kinase [Exophiala dermatitidis]KAJ4527357.1 Serine/threonine protein kinase [Exophiala dermatitidis]KAJ4530914.1 Serine/threonine protein kinase [Exophiala dermatitidis]
MAVTGQGSRPGSQSLVALEDRFEVIREIGDGSFGSVALARVRANGASVARRNTMVAIKTMKKTFDSFRPCMELREVIFLRTLPSHAHLVGALDIFLDPFSKKLHICMEYMDGNLYQLMKSREHKCMDAKSVKSILYQILSGLDHIHAHHFFHRDIKPENILVSTSAPQDSHSAFSRYSSLVTPPATPPAYSIKIADFGLARETHSKSPYTTYVSTRWYRAPEVLLRAGEYSAPVDIWAIGAMAVEVATLKPLFPGGNEVDQVWRVCEIMGSPGNWYTKNGARVGGGEWREGTKLAQKLGFSFPKMAPHAMETILQPPQWPLAFSNFVTWCLMWDPKNRPTTKQAMEHEFFADAVDPLRPKSSSRLLGRKHSDLSFRSKETAETPTITSKPSWFRRSLIARESAPAVPQHNPEAKNVQTESESLVSRLRPQANKRATWANGSNSSGVAPMPILPSIRPISPLPNAVTAQASSAFTAQTEQHSKPAEEKSKKIGRQLSINSHGNHYADVHRQEAERALNANSGLVSPPNGHKESFFSHLRKRARRFSGRHGLSSPSGDDVEANAANVPWSNRSSIMVDSIIPETNTDFSDLDKILQNVRYSLDQEEGEPTQRRSATEQPSNQGSLKRTHSVPRSQGSRSGEALNHLVAPTAVRSRRPLQVNQYETPEEADELLDEALRSASRVAKRLDQTKEQPYRTALAHKDYNRQSLPHIASASALQGAYLTPSPSAKRNGVQFNPASVSQTQPLNITKKRPEQEYAPSHWPTPPYEDNEWAATAANSIFAAGSSIYR